MSAPQSPTRRGEPPAEIEIDDGLVRRLLESQHPDLALERLELVANGWDNCTFRLGEDLAVRLPRREVAASLILHEQRWLPEIARRISLPIPAPQRLGVPGQGYPWAWSVVPWYRGVSGAREPLAVSEASVLGDFLAELHVAAPAEAPANPFRGVPLAEREASFEERLASVRSQVDHLDPLALEEIWTRAVDAPCAAHSLWLHGDLHPKNVIVDRGRIAAVIDWGDLTAGDPACDLAAAWMLFPVEVHEGLWESYGRATEDLLDRARGWALLLGLIFLDAGLVSDPAFARLGRTVLERLADSMRK